MRATSANSSVMPTISSSASNVNSKKQIRYQLMEDPDTNEMFFGADDSCFRGPWDVLLGKEVKS